MLLRRSPPPGVALLRSLACTAVVLTACGKAAVAPSPPEPPRAVTPSAAAPASAPRRAFAYPEAPKRPVRDVFFGTTVTDEHRWLEDASSPETRAWIDAENALSRAHLDGLPERGVVRERLGTILGKTSSDWMALRRAGGSLFGVKAQPPKQQPMVVVLPEGKELSLAQERVVVDPNVLDPSGKTTVDFFVPSPDGKLVAVSLSKDGSEDGDLHVYDVASGKALPDVVARVHGGTAGGSVAWRADGKALWYTRYPRAGEKPEADLGFFQEVWLHVLGEDASKDAYAFGKGLPKIAEIALASSDDGKSVLAEVSNGDGGEVEQHVLARGAWVRLSRFEDGFAHAVFGEDGKVYAISRKDAPHGKVVAFAPPFDKAPVTVLPESDGVLEDLVVTKDALYTVELVGGPSRVRRIPLDPKAEPLARETPAAKAAAKGSKAGKGPKPKTPPVTIAPFERGVPSAELPLPPVSSVTSALRLPSGDLLLRVESFTAPPAWHRYRAAEHKLVATPLAKTSPVDFSDIEVSRETCTSKDGTRVPMSLLRRKDAPKDGMRPALLTGYGGFDVSRKPRMRGWYRVWLDAGGVVADANLRGGGELGEAWHKAGMLTQKQNVFDDFAGCMRALVDLGWTRPERLAIHGRSNGGLLMGATIAQHPELFRVAVAEVGLYDMLRTELSPNGAFNVTEYGTVKDEAQFRALLGYSPVHNVKDGVAYPAVLFTTGENDPRVDPYHSRKMTARLQAATTSDRPILLRASRGTGHGMGTPLALEIEETADTIAFLMHEVGATPSR